MARDELDTIIALAEAIVALSERYAVEDEDMILSPHRPHVKPQWHRDIDAALEQFKRTPLPALKRDGSQDAAVNPAEADAGAAASDPQGQLCAPRPWEGLRTQEQARAWLATASVEELRAMEARWCQDGPVSPEEVGSLRLIGLALCASEALSRRLTSAEVQGIGLKAHWRAPECTQGSRS